MRTIYCLILASLCLITSRANAQPGSRHIEHYTATAVNTQLLDDGDYFWSETYGGIVRFKKQDHTYKLFPYFRGWLLKDRVGRVWSYSDSSVSMFDGSNWSSTAFEDDTLYPPGSFYGRDSDWFREPFYVTGLSFDSKNRAWVKGNTSMGRISLFHSSDTGWVRLHLPDFGMSYKSMLIDRADNIWITGEEQSTARYGYSSVLRIHDTSYTVWREEDKLPSHANSGDFRQIVMDSSGSVWVSRYGGASRFTPTGWINYEHTFADTVVLASTGTVMNVGQNDLMWFGGYGVSVRKQESWTNFRYLMQPSVLRAGTSGAEWAVGDGQGAWRFAGGAWKHFTTIDGLPDTNTFDVIADAQGEVLIATGNGVARYDGSRWSLYSIPNSPLGNQLGMLALDHANTLWVGDQQENGSVVAGVQSFDGSKWMAWRAPYALPVDNVTGLATHPNGSTWVSTDSGGFSSYDGMRWSNVVMFDTAAKDREYKCITIDSTGAVWAGALTRHLVTPVPPRYFVDNQEVLRWKDGSWTRFGPEDIQNRAAFSFNAVATAPDGTVWGTGAQADTLIKGAYHYRGGLYKFSGRAWQTINFDDNAADLTFNVGDVINIARDGSVWLSLQNVVKDNKANVLGPIVHYDGKTWRHYGGKPGVLPGARAYCFAQDLDGGMLAGTDLGIVKFDGTSWSIKYPLLPDLRSAPQSIVVAKDGSMWASTLQTGIVHLDVPSSRVDRAQTNGLSQIVLYPNPSFDRTLHVRFQANIAKGSIQVFNSAGDKLLVLDYSTTQGIDAIRDLDISSLPVGGYFVRVSGIESSAAFVKE